MTAILTATDSPVSNPATKLITRSWKQNNWQHFEKQYHTLNCCNVRKITLTKWCQNYYPTTILRSPYPWTWFTKQWTVRCIIIVTGNGWLRIIWCHHYKTREHRIWIPQTGVHHHQIILKITKMFLIITQNYWKLANCCWELSNHNQNPNPNPIPKIHSVTV